MKTLAIITINNDVDDLSASAATPDSVGSNHQLASEYLDIVNLLRENDLSDYDYVNYISDAQYLERECVQFKHVSASLAPEKGYSYKKKPSPDSINANQWNLLSRDLSELTLSVLKKQVITPLLDRLASAAEDSGHCNGIVFFLHANQSKDFIYWVSLIIMCCSSYFSNVVLASITKENDKLLFEYDEEINLSEVIQENNSDEIQIGISRADEEIDVGIQLDRYLAVLGWPIELFGRQLIVRSCCAVRKNERYREEIASKKRKLGLDSRNDISSSSSSSSEQAQFIEVDSIATDNLKPLPDIAKGLAVYEFFSGIGGMKLSLPKVIQGIPVTSVTAFDCSEVACQVYRHNFLPTGNTEKDKLLSVAIEGLKVEDIDNKADIWTMSPPCQPYTTTKGAKTLDARDNRTKGLFHLMYLLRNMRNVPRWIFLENVKGFLTSDMLYAWKKTLASCGYIWRQFLVSPIHCVSLPNHRQRYYMIIEHRQSQFSNRLLWSPAMTAVTSDANSKSANEASSVIVVDPPVQKCLPPALRSKFPSQTQSIGVVVAAIRSVLDLPSSALNGNNAITCSSDSAVLADVPTKDASSVYSQLIVPLRILQKPWACGRLSIVTDADTQTYCFTKAYGKLYDRSTGSLFLENPTSGSNVGLDSPHSNQAAVENDQALPSTTLEHFDGRLRMFHPRELLAIFGFPMDFVFPDDMVLHRQFACIGNSINVTVVKEVMNCLFDASVELE